MKTSLVLLLCTVVVAVEYSALKDVIARAPVHSLRLSEIEAKIESSGPMDLVGSLCYKQLQEIMAEIGQLTSTHTAYQAACDETNIKLTGQITNRKAKMSTEQAAALAADVSALSAKRGLAYMERLREELRLDIAARYAQVNKKNAVRAATKATYDTDMVDFNKALSDLDNIKNILVASASFDEHGKAKDTFAKTPEADGATAVKPAAGFLEAVDKVQSDYFKAMTNRLTRGAQLLETEGTGIDKLMALIYEIRNELWEEMAKLTEEEKESIQEHKQWLLIEYQTIRDKKILRAVRYLWMGSKLKIFADNKIKEANHYIAYATSKKHLQRHEIDLHFSRSECVAEQPLYAKAKANKQDEITTIEQMIQILRNLNWSGSVYSAIARIGASGIDENPEPGYRMALQMDLSNSVLGTQYTFTETNIPAFSRLAIKLTIGDTWAWASFDKFSGMTFAALKIPTLKNGNLEQRYVENLKVFALSRMVKTGSSAKGNLEMWPNNFGKSNFNKIPGASDGQYDFGDHRHTNGKYGSFQVHDYLNKQTVLSFSGYTSSVFNIGIGSQRVGPMNQQPDWTAARNSKRLQDQQQALTLTWYFQPNDWNKGLTHSGKVEKAPAPTAAR